MATRVAERGSVPRIPDPGRGMVSTRVEVKMGRVSEAARQQVRFEPTRPATAGRIVAALILGSVLWIAAIAVTAVVLHRTSAIELGLAVTLGSFLVSMVLLGLLRAVRRREEERDANRG